MFDAGELAVLANVGTLREPLDRAAYFANPQRRPPQLFSHNDQQSMWQSSVGEGATSGWGGRLADLLLDGNAMHPARRLRGRIVGHVASGESWRDTMQMASNPCADLIVVGSGR